MMMPLLLMLTLAMNAIDDVMLLLLLAPGVNYKVVVKDAGGAKHTVTIFKPLPHTGNPPSVSSVSPL